MPESVDGANRGSLGWFRFMVWYAVYESDDISVAEPTFVSRIKKILAYTSHFRLSCGTGTLTIFEREHVAAASIALILNDFGLSMKSAAGAAVAAIDEIKDAVARAANSGHQGGCRLRCSVRARRHELEFSSSFCESPGPFLIMDLDPLIDRIVNPASPPPLVRRGRPRRKVG